MNFLSISKQGLRYCSTFAIISLFIFTSSSLAQLATGDLALTIKDVNGSVIAGVKVDLLTSGLSIRSTTTDENGIARLSGIKPGEYKLAVSANGFTSVRRDISFVEGSNPASEIVLEVGGVNESLTVTATRTQVTTEETAVPVSVVDREELDRKAINTVGDIFRTLPGTSTTNEGAFQVRPRIRGLESNRVLILVDGERLNNSRTSTDQSGIEPGLVDISQIESVEVARGSGSVLYGTDALAGTINIITKDTPARREGGFRFSGALDTFYRSNENGRRGNLAVNGSGKYFAFRVSQSLNRFNNYSTGDPSTEFLTGLRESGVDITDEGEVLNSQSHGGNTSAMLRFFVNDNNTIRASYDRHRAGNIGSQGLAGVFNAFFPFSNRDKVSGRWDSVALTENLQRLSVTGFYQTQYRTFTNILTVGPVPPFFPGMYQYSETVTDTKTSGFDVQTDWTLGSRNTLVAGVSFFRDDNTDRRLLINSTTSWSPHRSFSNTKSVPDASLTNFSGFAQDEFRVTKRLKLIGGVRVDNFKTKADPTTGFAIPPLRQEQIDDLRIGRLATGLDVSNTAVTGDVGAVYKVTQNVTASARIGRSFRTPNIFELFFTGPGSIGGQVVGNPYLEPETGVNFDTSVKVRTKRFTASATYFNNSYKNFLSTEEANDNRNCPVYVFSPVVVYDLDNCFPVSWPTGRAPVRVYQTLNIGQARIQGFESEFEVPIKISIGYLTPNGNFSYLRGDDTGLDRPLNNISPFRTNFGVRWQNIGKAYYFDYSARIIGTQKRLRDPGAEEPGFVTHDLRGGYYFRKERFNFGVHLGVSNLLDRAYSEQFTFAPARGRSFTIGTTWEIR